jgi:hypothetical protein
MRAALDDTLQPRLVRRKCNEAGSYALVGKGPQVEILLVTQPVQATLRIHQRLHGILATEADLSLRPWALYFVAAKPAVTLTPCLHRSPRPARCRRSSSRIAAIAGVLSLPVAGSSSAGSRLYRGAIAIAVIGIGTMQY